MKNESTKNIVPAKKLALLCIQAAFLLTAVGCAFLGPNQEEKTAQMKVDIKRIADMPLAQFLSAYYTKTAGEATSIVIEAKVAANQYDEILNPSLVLKTYCEDNNAILLRIQNSQLDSWAEYSPEAFADIRTSSSARQSMSDMGGGSDTGLFATNPGFGMAQASRAGAFGIFLCRENATSRTLWKAEVRQSGTAVVLRNNHEKASLQLTVSVVSLKQNWK